MKNFTIPSSPIYKPLSDNQVPVPLFDAIKEGEIDKIVFLIENFKFDINFKDELNPKTPLQMMSERGYEYMQNIFRKLCDKEVCAPQVFIDMGKEMERIQDEAKELDALIGNFGSLSIANGDNTRNFKTEEVFDAVTMHRYHKPIMRPNTTNANNSNSSVIQDQDRQIGNPFHSDIAKSRIYENCVKGSPFQKWMQTASPNVIEVLSKMNDKAFESLVKSKKSGAIYGQDVGDQHKPGLIDLPLDGLAEFVAAINNGSFLNQRKEKRVSKRKL